MIKILFTELAQSRPATLNAWLGKFILLCSIEGGIVYSTPTFAKSITEFAQDSVSPVLNIASLVLLLCRIVGIGLIVASVIHYIEYRKGLGKMTLTGILSMLVGGLALLAITFIPFQN